ncbi:Trafficking protein particle complex subunit 6B [Trichuris trichiura]|uniref:Trafficking protein particle complex subunit 6B n=1 Tax=Trichuris trichiura TaxID=36087 RepID=A0A077YXQ2_TRITR|nr:Trafficking protein particle complex subunit 6B [Trichuris trichiura]
MTDVDYPLQYLHIEIVSYFSNVAEASNNPGNVSFQPFQPLVIEKLESMGLRIGYALCERLTKEQPRMASELEIFKFICRDFWRSMFGKQVDSLKTNHQGIYVITDGGFKLMPPFSNTGEFRSEAPRYLALSRGIIKGALCNLGLSASVVTDIPEMPVIRFSVTLKDSG